MFGFWSFLSELLLFPKSHIGNHHPAFDDLSPKIKHEIYPLKNWVFNFCDPLSKKPISGILNNFQSHDLYQEHNFLQPNHNNDSSNNH